MIWLAILFCGLPGLMVSSQAGSIAQLRAGSVVMLPRLVGLLQQKDTCVEHLSTACWVHLSACIHLYEAEDRAGR